MSKKNHLTRLEIENIKLQAQNEILYQMMQKDYYVEGHIFWVNFHRVKEEAECCDNIEEFREWLNDLTKYFEGDLLYEKK